MLEVGGMEWWASSAATVEAALCIRPGVVSVEANAGGRREALETAIVLDDRNLCTPREGNYPVMNKLSLAVGAAGLAALVTLTACGTSSTEQAAPSTTSAAGVTGTDAHNQADVRFAQQMIPHHAQAVQMSDILLAKEGIDPRVTEMAGQIKAAQGPEIEQMQAWLTEWGLPTMPMGTTGMPMPGHDTSMMPGTGMPGPDDVPMPSPPDAAPGPGMNGMMSEQDMAALQNAEGTDASRMFLTQMIAHHRGAITMAQNEIDTGEYPDAVALARSIAESQQQEITTMENIVATL